MASFSRVLRRSFSTATISPTTSSTAASTTLSRKGLADSLFKERSLTKVVQMFKQSSESYRFRTKHNIYENTVRRLRSAQKFKWIEEILEEQKKYHDITKEGFAIRLISLYGKAGMLDHASKTFNQLPELNCERTVKSLNALLTACIESKEYEEVEKHFRELPSKLGVTPDAYSYTIFIQALCEMGDLDSAYSVFEEMEKKGVESTVVTFNNLLKGFYNGGRFLDGERIWNRMVTKGVAPGILTYNARLKGLALAGKISEAVKLIAELKVNGPKPDTFSYNALFQGYCDEGKLDDAKRVYDEFLENDLKENKWTYEILIPAFVKKGDIEFALKLCKKTLGYHCYIDAGIVQSVVEGLVKEDKVKDAKNLIRYARTKSYSPSKVKLPSESK